MSRTVNLAFLSWFWWVTGCAWGGMDANLRTGSVRLMLAFMVAFTALSMVMFIWVVLLGRLLMLEGRLLGELPGLESAFRLGAADGGLDQLVGLVEVGHVASVVAPAAFRRRYRALAEIQDFLVVEAGCVYVPFAVERPALNVVEDGECRPGWGEVAQTFADEVCGEEGVLAEDVVGVLWLGAGG